MNPDTHIEAKTKVYTSEDGHAVIEQSTGQVIRLSAEEILAVIRELHACYDYCAAQRQSTQEQGLYPPEHLAMEQPIRILLQTTIEPTPNDWHIGRFSLLRDYLGSLREEDGQRLFDVTARDRDPVSVPDSVLSRLDDTPYDQLWLFAVDVGDGLHEEDRAGILQFRA